MFIQKNEMSKSLKSCCEKIATVGKTWGKNTTKFYIIFVFSVTLIRKKCILFYWLCRFRYTNRIYLNRSQTPIFLRFKLPLVFIRVILNSFRFKLKFMMISKTWQNSIVFEAIIGLFIRLALGVSFYLMPASI